MPNLMGISDVDAQKTMSNFEYSAKRLDQLGASEYTLCSIQVDTSTSVTDFRSDLIRMLKTIVETVNSSRNPRSENTLLRVTTFDNTLNEVHGFVPLDDIEVDKYADHIQPKGWTALYDATLDSLEAIKSYGDTLVQMDYRCNGIAFVITDGGENSSRTANVPAIIETLKKIKSEENLESLKIILIGVGDESGVRQDLEDFQREVSIDQFEWAGKATPDVLAKMAEFVSQSISSQSQALGTGQPSQNITF